MIEDDAAVQTAQLIGGTFRTAILALRFILMVFIYLMQQLWHGLRDPSIQRTLRESGQRVVIVYGIVYGIVCELVRARLRKYVPIISTCPFLTRQHRTG